MIRINARNNKNCPCFLSHMVLGHSNVFICFASFENPKTYQPAREKNKQEKITKSMQIF
jgi:hypothetical protein